MEKFQYQISEHHYPFRDFVEDALNVKDLTRLKLNCDIFTQESDQSSTLHKIWYKYVDDNPEFLKCYRSFALVRTALALGYSDYLIQAKPTIRFHLPGNLAVGEFHRDRDYAHNPHEINVFVPLTPAFDNNTIWIESKEGLEDYKPIEAKYGEAVIFDGANLKHGNRLNNTLQTRVSFDFRLLRKCFYNNSNEQRSTTAGKRFVLGEYWSE